LRFDFGSAGNGYSCNAQWSLWNAQEREHETSKLVSAVSALRTLSLPVEAKAAASEALALPLSGRQRLRSRGIKHSARESASIIAKECSLHPECRIAPAAGFFCDRRRSQRRSAVGDSSRTRTTQWMTALRKKRPFPDARRSGNIDAKRKFPPCPASVGTAVGLPTRLSKHLAPFFERSVVMVAPSSGIGCAAQISGSCPTPFAGTGRQTARCAGPCRTPASRGRTR
jgi:hypothetical protein